MDDHYLNGKVNRHLMLYSEKQSLPEYLVISGMNSLLRF